MENENVNDTATTIEDVENNTPQSDADVFKNILDKDETIIKIYKPNKLKMFFSTFFATFFIYLVFAITIIVGLAPASPANYLTLAILISLAIFVVFVTIALLFVNLEYKNIYYAYSNKRIIIRKGIFGIDYKSLDMTMIGAVTVNVSLIDKILRKNTGTISFGSTANPMGQNAALFAFANITSPYETYKEIKSVIDDAKFTAGKRK